MQGEHPLTAIEARISPKHCIGPDLKSSDHWNAHSAFSIMDQAHSLFKALNTVKV